MKIIKCICTVKPVMYRALTGAWKYDLYEQSTFIYRLSSNYIHYSLYGDKMSFIDSGLLYTGVPFSQVWLIRKPTYMLKCNICWLINQYTIILLHSSSCKTRHFTKIINMYHYICRHFGSSWPFFHLIVLCSDVEMNYFTYLLMSSFVIKIVNVISQLKIQMHTRKYQLHLLYIYEENKMTECWSLKEN